MNKILIIGNSGSGKSWLASQLSERLGVKEVSLDSIHWEVGGYNQKRPQSLVDVDVSILCAETTWIVEGVFGHLAEQFIDSTDTLIFLDLDWSQCKKSLLARGSESSKQLDCDLAEENFQKLLSWASDYSSRESKSSRGFHNQLFNAFSGQKIRFTERKQVNIFISEKLHDFFTL